MNNEPVAWIDKNTGKPRMEGFIQTEYDIPLYTHPAKTEDEPNWKEMYWEMHELNHKHWSELKAHPAKTEEFVAGDAICPSCGCKSLYKTARSEWCVTHKCLWQKDYELTLTDEEIMECKAHVEVMYGCLAPLEFAWLILKKASEK